MPTYYIFEVPSFDTLEQKGHLIRGGGEIINLFEKEWDKLTSEQLELIYMPQHLSPIWRGQTN